MSGETLPEMHPNPVESLEYESTNISVFEIKDERNPLPLANSGRESARVADDGNYAFYRPTDGLVYPMIQ